MRNLIKFIIRYHFFFLFVVIEIIALSLVFNSNYFQKAAIVNLSRQISGNLYQKGTSLTEYLKLREINRRLVQENMGLKNELLSLSLHKESVAFRPDSLLLDRYFYNSARVINQKINRQRNFLTLNIGRKDGVETEMAVISANGIVGIVNGVSENFSTVMPLINIDSRISARLRSNNYFGSLFWDGKDYRQVILSEIPHHAVITLGDTVVTSGYSAIFPHGLPIGIVTGFEIRGANFYDINVHMFTNFKNLTHVYVLGNRLKEEQILLETQLEND